MENLNKNVLDVFGRIIYAVAKSDGEVQEEETAVIQDIIDNHSWAQEIELSFAIESALDEDSNIVFDDAIEAFKFNEIGDHASEFVGLLEKIAEAHDGIVSEEKALIDRFKTRLEENGLL
jgi:uncharacterized tellurite resistance protein B-like protein